MADKPAREETEEGEKKGGIGALLQKTPVLLGGVMVLEAVVLFAAFKMLAGGPADSHGAELVDDHSAANGAEVAHAKDGPAEIPLIDFRAPNKMSGRTYLYDVSIVILTKQEHAERVKSVTEQRGALIQDRLRTIIAQSNPDKLGGGSEPGLETLRRQVKYQLDQIVGEGLVEEVLVPKCTPFRADF
ncbi:MAG: hypothetical protein ACFCVE_07825 [Phycisphaerae bacterium]